MKTIKILWFFSEFGWIVCNIKNRNAINFFYTNKYGIT